jgi:PAS domain S-box-containing protein
MAEEGSSQIQQKITAILHEVMAQLSFAIVTLDRDAKITFASPNLTSWMGYDNSEILGKSAREFLHFNDIGVSRQQFEQLLTTPMQQINLITKLRHKNGWMLWLEVTARNLIGTPGMDGIFLILRKIEDSNRQLDNFIDRVAEHARNEERHFIATELHDNINQIISASKLMIDSAIDHPHPQDLLAQSSANLSIAVEEIRKLCAAAVRFSVGDFGLGGSIQRFINSMKGVIDIEVDVTIDERIESAASHDQKHHLFRIFQEAWNNTVKYSKATRMSISLSLQKELGRLDLRDNGIGFNVSKATTGVGLLSVAKRVRALNGHYHIQSWPSKGTDIQVHFPLSSESS